MKPSEDSNRGIGPAYSKTYAAVSRLTLEGNNWPAIRRAAPAIRTGRIHLKGNKMT